MTPEQIADALGGARRDGNGYVAICPCHPDNRASLGLHLGDDGRLLWHCRAGCSQDAVRDALASRGLLNGHARDPMQRRAAPRAPAQSAAATAVPMTPAPEAEPDMRDARMGAPTATWTYRDADERPLYHVARYDTPEGKSIRPWTWDGSRWQQRAYPAPRPLYGLDRLARLPDALVLLTEGEKCADAAHVALGADTVCMSWCGGAAAVGKSDWTPLRDRGVLVWPDRDDPGRKAAVDVLQILPHAELLDVPGADGWDVADLLDAEGADAVRRFVAECTRLPAPAPEAAQDASDWTADVEPPEGSTDAPRGAQVSAWPAPLDLAALADHEPEQPRHIVPSWLPEGEVTLFAGHGGAGKSAIALHLAACIAVPAHWCGLEVSQRHVYVVSCEDGRDVLHWRLARISRHLRVSLAELGERLHVIDASAMHAELMIEPGRGDEPIMTGLYTALAEVIEPGSVVVIDGASDTYGASEILRRHVRRFVRALRRLAGEHGAVLLLAHVDKAAARSRESGDRYSGSTAWHNSVRARWELQSDGADLVLSLAKANHARAGAEIRLRWDESAHMHLPAAAQTDSGMMASIRERTERDGILAAMRGCAAAGVIVPAAMQGPWTAYHALAQRPEFPSGLRDGKGARALFRRHIEALRQIRAFEEMEIRRGNRHYTLALVLADRGSAPHAPDSE